MKSVNKVENATEADWTFFEDPRAVTEIEKAARKAEDRFEHVEYDDAYQDALLWLSVRPERYAQAVLDGDWTQLRQDIYSPLAKRAKAEAQDRRYLVSYDDELGAP